MVLCVGEVMDACHEDAHHVQCEHEGKQLYEVFNHVTLESSPKHEPCDKGCTKL